MWRSGGPRPPWRRCFAPDLNLSSKYADCAGRSGWKQLYYILILPYVYATFDTLLGRLLAVAAIYHWGGLAFGEGLGLFDKWSAGTAAASNGKTVIAMSAVAVLDIAEMALLAWLLWILVVPVTAVTGIAAVPA